ncbi:MAG: glycosyl hydrolase family 43 [Gammaproteobacteria bacterium]|nr:glycosyl hydrolase family 43 [Gammaproteobacteria bacterium]
MSFPPKSQLWHCGIARLGIERFLPEPPFGGPVALLREQDVVWLPLPGPWRYIADPFGIWRDDRLHVFVEAYDYLTRKGTIQRHEFDSSLQWLDSAPCLEAAFHLSYPFVFEFEGETFMLPEQSRSGRLALYRAKRFPDSWEEAGILFDNLPVVDPSLIRHDGKWWMFFAIAGDAHRDRRELHVASASQLLGPWHLHPGSPVVRGLTHARPGGTPWKALSGDIILPVQDCSRSYGGSLNFLRITHLDPQHIVISPLDTGLQADVFSDEWKDGAHTLARAGSVTLFDVKKNHYSFGRYVVDLRRGLRRLLPPP